MPNNENEIYALFGELNVLLNEVEHHQRKGDTMSLLMCKRDVIAVYARLAKEVNGYINGLLESGDNNARLSEEKNLLAKNIVGHLRSSPGDIKVDTEMLKRVGLELEVPLSDMKSSKPTKDCSYESMETKLSKKGELSVLYEPDDLLYKAKLHKNGNSVIVYGTTRYDAVEKLVGEVEKE